MKVHSIHITSQFNLIFTMAVEFPTSLRAISRDLASNFIKVVDAAIGDDDSIATTEFIVRLFQRSYPQGLEKQVLRYMANFFEEELQSVQLKNTDFITQEIAKFTQGKNYFGFIFFQFFLSYFFFY